LPTLQGIKKVNGKMQALFLFGNKEKDYPQRNVLACKKTL